MWPFAAILSLLQQLKTQFASFEKQLTQMSGQIDTLIQKDSAMSAALDALTAQVTQNTTVEGSAVTLIQNIAAQLQAALNNNDDAALQNLTTELNTSATALAAAITANTPAAGSSAKRP
jgi:chromosome segregation ATPase